MAPNDARARIRKKRPALWILAAAGAFLMAFWTVQYTPIIERVTVGEPPANAAGFRIAQLSDLHVTGRIDLWRLKYAIELLDRENPDLIVLTGDYVRGDAKDIELAVPLLRQLRAPLGVYAVLGNHDVWSDREVVTRGLAEAGITLLNNAGTIIERDGQAFYLAGVDDGWSGSRNLNDAVAGNTAGLPVVLLEHEPDLGEMYVTSGRAWLLLAGHSHGGQVRLPRIGALILPHYGRIYDQGLYAVGQGWIYVNRGLGTAEIPIRLNCRPEVTLLTVYPPAADAP